MTVLHLRAWNVHNPLHEGISSSIAHAHAVFSKMSRSGLDIGNHQPGEHPDELWGRYQALRKEHDRGDAPYRTECEIALYRPGDMRIAKPMKDADLF